MGKQFTSKIVEKRDDIEFEIDGTKFYFKPVKQSTQLIKMLTVRGKGPEAEMERVASMLDWLAYGLDREYYKAYKKDPEHAVPGPDSQWQKLLDKLEDPDDPLELETVTEIITYLMEEITGRPTT